MTVFRALGVLTPGFHSRSCTRLSLTNQILAALNKASPLCLAAIDVLTDLLLTPTHQSTNAFRCLLTTTAQIFFALPGIVCDVNPGFTTALGGIENSNRGADSQTGQKPCKERFCYGRRQLELGRVKNRRDHLKIAPGTHHQRPTRGTKAVQDYKSLVRGVAPHYAHKPEKTV